MNRRSFLKFASVAAVGAATLGVRASIPAPTPEPVFEMLEMQPSFDHLTWGGARFVIDADCPPDMLYFINLKNVRRLPDAGLFDTTVFSVEPGTEREFATMTTEVS